MIKNFIVTNIVILFIFLIAQKDCFSNPSNGNKINNIKTSKVGKVIKLNLSLNKSPKYKVFSLKDPNRLVIDFENSSLNKSITASNLPHINSFRSAKRGDGGIRTVFGLNKSIKISKSTINNPSSDNQNYSLIVEIIEAETSKKTDSKKYSLSPLNSKIADKILTSKTISKEVKKPVIKKNNKKKIVSKAKTKRKKKIVVIDAGHGGKDPGAIGRYIKTKEKNVTLSFAKEIKKYLEKDKNFKVYLTRDRDYFISLGGRVEKGRKLKADLFISIHADSAENKKATGLSIYTLSEKSSDKEARKLARKENKSDIIGGVNFSGASGDILKTLIDLSQRSTMNNSAKFAEVAIKGLAKNKIKVKQHTHRFAGFRVLTAPDVPSVLIELGYLSNKGDEKKLNSSHYRRKFSKVLSKVIVGYFKNN